MTLSYIKNIIARPTCDVSHDQDHNPPFQFNWCGIKCDGREAGFDTLGKSKTAHHACMLFRLKVKVLRSEKVGFGFPNRLLAKESLINVLKPESGGIGSSHNNDDDNIKFTKRTGSIQMKKIKSTSGL